MISYCSVNFKSKSKMNNIEMKQEVPIYFYPYKKELSFSYIAEWHVRLLKEKYNIQEMHLTALPSLASYNRIHAYVHPYFYPLTTNGEIKDTILKRLRKNIDTLIAVDVADSNHLSHWAVEMANYATAFIVNSKWSYDAYVESGVKIPVHVIYHGLEHEWFRPIREPIHPSIKFINEIKKKKSVFAILYFLWHSGWRKGADLASQLIDCLERNNINYLLIIKKMDITDPSLKFFTKYKTFIVEGKLPRDWLIDLYDISDLVLLPSRGGSFELSGLEALGRGIPTLMPNVGPWIEYTPPGLSKYLWVKTARMVTVLPGNEIHDGAGAEWDTSDACEKALNIINNYQEVRAKAQEGIQWIRERFEWDVIKKELWRLHEKYFY